MHAAAPIAAPINAMLTRPRKAWAVAVGLTAMLCLPAQAQRLPPPGEWGYDISGQTKGLPYRASAILNWQHDAQSYTAQLTMKALLVGQRTQTSEGTLDAQGLRPLKFVDRARKERSYTLDWPGQRYLAQPGGATLALPTASQDRLSLFFQLGASLAQRHAPPAPGQTWTLPVLGASGTQNWTFAWKGVEKLEMPQGVQTAWRLDRQPREPGDTQMSLWFAPGLQFVPVRIRLTEADGDSVDQRLSEVRTRP